MKWLRQLFCRHNFFIIGYDPRAKVTTYECPKCGTVKIEL